MADKKKETPAEERLLTIPLRRDWLKAPRNRRARRSITTIRAFLSRHMKVPESDIRVSAGLNEAVWIRGAARPPAKIRIKASIDVTTGTLHARLPDEEAPKPEKSKEKPAKPEEAKKEPEKKEEPAKEEKPAEDKPAPAEKPAKAEKPREPEKKETKEKPKKAKTPKKG